MAAGLKVVMLVFANDHVDDRRYLRNLDRERAGIIEALEPLIEDERLGEPLMPVEPTVEAIWDSFLKPRFAGRIAVFHFGGHAHGSALIIEDEHGAPASSHAPGLASFLGQQPGLKLVVLNGCSTRGQVERLRAEGVPAVVATSTAIDDKVASTFAAVFYKALRSKPLGESFALAKAAVHNKWGPEPSAVLRRDHRDAAIESEPLADEGGWPWILSCDPEVEDWILAPADEDNPVPGPRWRPWALVGAVMVTVGLVAWLAGAFEPEPVPIPGPKPIPKPVPEPEPPTGMRWVPGGTVLRGSSEPEWRAAYEACRTLSTEAFDPSYCSENTWKREQRVHRETQVEPLFLDINEVTVREVAGWLTERVADGTAFIEDDFILDAQRRVWGKLREQAEPGRPELRQLRVTDQDVVEPEPGRGEHPIGLVTWSLAQAYCASRGARLPSEAEWEWAARGEERTTYPWGNEPLSCTGAVLDRVKGGRCADHGLGPAATGSGSEDVSWAKIRDLGGGVAEWVADAYVDETTVDERVARCVRAELSGGEQPRQCHVFKGGSWAWPTLFARAAARSVAETTPTDVDVLRRDPDRWVVVWDVGFRCARDVEDKP